MDPKPTGSARAKAAPKRTAKPRGGRKAVRASLSDQLDQAAAQLETGLAKQDLMEFYGFLRDSDLPFVALLHQGDPPRLIRACFEILHRLGGISPAVALALENHLYVTCALATFPVQEPRLEQRRRSLMESLRSGRLLVANTNSRLHADKLNTFGIVARREAGGFRVSGAASYMSLATQSDLLVFLTRLEDGGPAIFATRLRDNPGIEIGPFLFPQAMIDSDTRRVQFHDLLVAEEDLILAGKSELMSALIGFELAWHQILYPILYLGAAARAIEEARRFLRSIQTQDGHPLAELDGQVVDTGRMVLRYKAAYALIDQATRALGGLVREPLSAERLGEVSSLAGATKYVVTTHAEEIVTQARRIVGARSFSGGHPLERLSLETPFGPLGPEVNAFIERQHGRRALGEKPFSGIYGEF
jgi:alkylation response protein AidB-like acyl-CoA dehydrogenase